MYARVPDLFGVFFNLRVAVDNERKLVLSRIDLAVHAFDV